MARRQTPKLSERAHHAVDVISEHLERNIQKRGVKHYEQILITRGFVSGLCAMAQLNHLKLSEREAADVFRHLKPILDKMAANDTF
jgi:hypothetical protein